jgi:hypothetical protein
MEKLTVVNIKPFIRLSLLLFLNMEIFICAVCVLQINLLSVLFFQIVIYIWRTYTSTNHILNSHSQ